MSSPPSRSRHPCPVVALTPGLGVDVTAAGVIMSAGGPEPEPRRSLNGISDVRAFFHTNTVPLRSAQRTALLPIAHPRDEVKSRHSTKSLHGIGQLSSSSDSVTPTALDECQSTLAPGSCLGVVIRYETNCDPECCELAIKSDDPNHPLKTLDVVAFTRCPPTCECRPAPCKCEEKPPGHRGIFES